MTLAAQSQCRTVSPPIHHHTHRLLTAALSFGSCLAINRRQSCVNSQQAVVMPVLIVFGFFRPVDYQDEIKTCLDRIRNRHIFGVMPKIIVQQGPSL